MHESTVTRIDTSSRRGIFSLELDPANGGPGLAEPDPFFSHTGQEAEDLNWPCLANMTMSQERQRLRGNGVGGSDANIILGGDAERLMRLWAEKQGRAVPEDLSTELAVMLGSWTEPFNRQWFEQAEGHRVSLAGAFMTSRSHPWRFCSLDGFVASTGAVWEAKHTSAFAKPEEVVERYMPQLQHNMAVMESDRAILSVIFGNHRWQTFEVRADWLYQEELLIAETRFWDCVQTGERPIPEPIPLAPKAVGVREISFQGNNAWAAAAADWITNAEAAKLHATAAKAVKALVEDDVTRAYGHGIEARRSRAGALTIRETV